jgi:hypothetical protein
LGSAISGKQAWIVHAARWTSAQTNLSSFLIERVATERIWKAVADDLRAIFIVALGRLIASSSAPTDSAGSTLLLNALRPKRMVPQPDTARLVTSTKPGEGRLQSAGGANDNGGGLYAVGRSGRFLRIDRAPPRRREALRIGGLNEHHRRQSLSQW